MDDQSTRLFGAEELEADAARSLARLGRQAVERIIGVVRRHVVRLQQQRRAERLGAARARKLAGLRGR